MRRTRYTYVSARRLARDLQNRFSAALIRESDFDVDIRASQYHVAVFGWRNSIAVYLHLGDCLQGGTTQFFDFRCLKDISNQSSSHL